MLTSLMTVVTFAEPVLVTARSKAWVYDLLLAGIADTNPIEGTNVRPLYLLCFVQVAASATS
jgi:hypothetical protein